MLWAFGYSSLLLRLQAPVLVTAITFAALLGQDVLGGVSQPWAVLIALYSVATQRGARWAWSCAAAVVAILALVSVATPVNTESPVIAGFGICIVVLIGLNVRGRSAYLSALIDRAAQLEREREQEARLAASAERARIARELHDIVAHGMSLMITLSDAADATADVDPTHSRDAVRHIGVVGRDALTDMRRLLGVLHDEEEPAALTPQPGLDALDDLVETYRAAGLPVAVTTSGELPTAPAVQVVLYRTVQEGLTNALRYARQPERVSVILRAVGGDTGAESVGETIVEVSDDGMGSSPAVSVGTERGLVGLRQRAALFGGSLEAGPRPELGGRGWRLRLRLPAADPADRVEPAPTDETIQETM
ncbi:Signal transduction histidine kinase [Plantibacter flavus]|uniref:histidine kinase n=1 Tax=Plantibacter flavus TaxID=150123 RepID=A0A3N2BYK0_9MICO|nr:histidine kinase [Plantibacter flavus]ROR80328.1 signal transduction histidine kinase [Plantibacter flavus]SMG35288.1 Signal transduction histidine kinase [Plantibacter flavus]